MKLKKIKLYGFKSFADEVVLDFSEEVTALVGPNGCGKSNIVDAFRWVLGEQSARSMRADKMHDVIFSGSQSRKPLNIAEVSITLSEMGAPFDEVVITRRLYRTGESEYLINKEPSRLKDIQNLFLSGGMGKNAFSIFEQGKLDEIIHLSPLERRSLFDDAAGTTKFLQSKKETSKHLREVSQNHARIKDLHHEIDKRRKQLKKQAEEALQHQERKKELEQLETAILSSKWRKLTAKLEGLEEQKKKLREDLILEKKNYEEIEKHLERYVTELLEKEKEMKECEEKVYHFSSQFKIKTAEERREKEKIQELEERLKKNTDALNFSAGGYFDEIKNLEKKRIELEQKKKELESLTKAKEEKYITFEKAFEELEEKEKKARKDEQKAKDAKAALERELFRKQEEEKRLEREIEENRLLLSELEVQEKKKKEELQIELGKLENNKNEAQKVEDEIKEIESTLQKLKAEHQELRELSARMSALQENRKGLSSGREALFKESKNRKSPWYQKIKAEEAFPFFSVESEDDLLELVSFCREKKWDDFALATKATTEKIVFLPYSVQNDRDCGLASVQKKEKEKGIALNETLQMKESLVKKRGLLLEKIRKNEMDHLQANFFLQQTLRELKKVKSDLEKASAAREKKTLTDLLKKIEEEVQIEAQAKALCRHLEELLSEKRKERISLLDEKKKEDATFYALLSDLRSIIEKIEVLKNKEEEREGREKRLKSDHANLKASLEASRKKAIEFGHDAKIASQTLEDATHQQKDLKEEMLGGKKQKEDLEKYLIKERKKAEVIENQIHKNDIAHAEAVAFLQPILKEAPLEKLEKSMLCENLEEAEKRALALRYDLERGKMVNLTSIEESRLEEERFHQIDVQLLDLQATKADIEKVIQKLEQESKKAFKTTFEAVRKNFQKNFSLFFNGGEADLRFTESSDILEAGVEILAEPPGKQMKTISLLSGGEKCMTALALLFSIFEVRPAPFCILDEVDAPLDDLNVQRFTKVLKQFVSTTQFIIVTHNKKTMGIADILFGVSMEEKGVSKLISLVFEKEGSRACL